MLSVSLYMIYNVECEIPSSRESQHWYAARPAERSPPASPEYPSWRSSATNLRLEKSSAETLLGGFWPSSVPRRVIDFSEIQSTHW